MSITHDKTCFKKPHIQVSKTWCETTFHAGPRYLNIYLFIEFKEVVFQDKMNPVKVGKFFGSLAFYRLKIDSDVLQISLIHVGCSGKEKLRLTEPIYIVVTILFLYRLITLEVSLR